MSSAGNESRVIETEDNSLYNMVPYITTLTKSLIGIITNIESI